MMGNWATIDARVAREATGVQYAEIERALAPLAPAYTLALPGLDPGGREVWRTIQARSAMNHGARSAAGIPGPSWVLVFGRGVREMVADRWHWSDQADAASVCNRLNTARDPSDHAPARGALGL